MACMEERAARYGIWAINGCSCRVCRIIAPTVHRHARQQDRTGPSAPDRATWGSGHVQRGLRYQSLQHPVPTPEPRHLRNWFYISVTWDDTLLRDLVASPTPPSETSVGWLEAILGVKMGVPCKIYFRVGRRCAVCTIGACARALRVRPRATASVELPVLGTLPFTAIIYATTFVNQDLFEL